MKLFLRYLIGNFPQISSLLTSAIKKIYFEHISRVFRIIEIKPGNDRWSQSPLLYMTWNLYSLGWILLAELTTIEQLLSGCIHIEPTSCDWSLFVLVCYSFSLTKYLIKCTCLDLALKAWTSFSQLLADVAQDNLQFFFFLFFFLQDFTVSPVKFFGEGWAPVTAVAFPYGNVMGLERSTNLWKA